MVKKPPAIKTVDDIKKVMEEKRTNAEKRRQEMMASGDAEPNGVSAADVLTPQNVNGKAHNGANTSLNESQSSPDTPSSSKASKRAKKKANAEKQRQEALASEDVDQSNDTPINGTSSNGLDTTVEGGSGATPMSRSAAKRARKRMKAERERQEALTNKENEPETTEDTPDSKQSKGSASDDVEPPATTSRKRKASERAKEQLAVVPLSQREDDTDPEDREYIVESPDEDGNPKRARIEESQSDNDSDDDWSRQTLEQRIAQMLAGGVFYDDSEEDDGESDESSESAGIVYLNLHEDDDEDDTEVEISDSDDEAGRIDIHESSGEEAEDEDSDDHHEDESEDEEGEFSDDHFDDAALLESDSYDDEEIMSFDEDRPPNSDEEIDDVISTIRPKEDEMAFLDNLTDPGSEDSSVIGPVDDLDELAEDDEDDLYAEDSDEGDDLGGFIAPEGEVEHESGDSDEDEDEDDDDDMDIDLGDDEYTDISPMYQMTTDYKFEINGYRTLKDNAFLLKLQRTTGAKSRVGPFTPFLFGQIPDTHSVQIATDAFAWMIGPVENQAFFNHLFQRRVLYVHRRDKNYYKGLFSSNNLLRMVQENDLEYGTNINVAHYDREGGRTTHNPVGRVFAHQLKAFVKAGMSIQCINPQSFNDEIWYLCEILQELTNNFVGANTYLTPAESAGFAPHWDEVDAFIIQVEGKKYWRVWAPADGDEALPDESSRNFTEKEMADKNLVFEGTIEEGDMLYVPRGFYHSASTGAEHSLHVTVSLCHNVTFTHLMKGISEEVWDSIRQSRMIARRSLPPGYLEMAGVAPLEYEEGLEEHIMPVVKSMLEDISQTYRDGIASAVDKMALDFYKSALPPMLSPTERKHSIHGEEGLSMFNDPEIKVTRLKEIRFIRQHAQRLLYENEETPFIVHRMANSRVLSENKESKIINIDKKMVNGILTLFQEYPQWIKVKDLGCGKQVNVELAEILYNNGLLMMRDKPV